MSPVSIIKDRKPLWLAQAEKENGDEEKPLSPECAAFAKDPNADVGDIIRAGCQPTTGQMSALMDNPLGNVAMLFTQVDVFVLENPTNDKDANKVTSIGAAPNIIANWEQDSGNKWTVPIGLAISRTFQIGKVPVRFGFEVHYSVIQPDDVAGQKWDFRFYAIPAAPSALFKWMQ